MIKITLITDDISFYYIFFHSAIKQISKDSSKRISKKDRKEQRAEFRSIEDWVLKGESPDESLRMQGAVLTLDSFKTLRVAEALRDVLGTGFHSALRIFPVVK